MTVFKGCLKIARSKIFTTLMFIAIFALILAGFQNADEKSGGESFEYTSVKVGIINEDNGILSKGLCEYLDKDNEVIYEENNKSDIQEKMYYRDIEYVIWIPENFVEKCIEGTENLRVMAIPEMMTGSYMQAQVNSYMASAKMFYDSGSTEDEIVNYINNYEKPEIDYVSDKKDTGHKTFQVGMAFMPYIFMGIMLYTLGGIFISFNEKSIRQRFQASAISGARKNLEMLMAFIVYSIIIWVIIMGMEILMFGNEFLSSPNIEYYIINSIVLLILVMSMSYLMGSAVKNIELVSAITNVLSVGMSFLCGVFVDMEFLPEQVLKVSMFLPVYWYEKTCVLLRSFGNISGNVRTDFFKYQGIQLLYAAAFIMIALVVSKNRRTEE